MALRRHGSGEATYVGGPPPPMAVVLGPGHLGVTLSNHPLGVLVDRADEADSVFGAGIRVGDVIVAVDDERVSDHETACALLGSNVDRPIVLHDGPQPGHSVEFFTAATAANLLASRRSFTHMLGGDALVRRMGLSEMPGPAASDGGEPAAPAGGALGLPAGLRGQLLLAVLAFCAFRAIALVELGRPGSERGSAQQHEEISAAISGSTVEKACEGSSESSRIASREACVRRRDGGHAVVWFSTSRSLSSMESTDDANEPGTASPGGGRSRGRRFGSPGADVLPCSARGTGGSPHT